VINDFSTLVTGIGRLTFKGMGDIVGPFIVRRHQHFGAQRVEFDDLSRADGVILHISAENPLTDFRSVEQGLALMQAGATLVKVEGAVPGTNFERLERSGSTKRREQTVLAGTQLRLNNQFNLRKIKRQKMFRILVAREPELWKFDIDELDRAVKRQHVHLALYGVSENFVEEKSCPACGSGEMSPLYGRASQPVIGYVSPDIPLYFQCRACGLGFMTPRVSSDRVEELYDDYDAADGAMPVEMIAAALISPKHTVALRFAASAIPANARVLDLGGGSGRFSLHAKQEMPHWSVVHSDFAVRQNPHLTDRGIETRTINIVEDEFGKDEFDLITAFEVIEHLDYRSFVGLVAKLKQALRPGGCFLLTTPDLDSPLIRAFDFFNAYAPHHLLLFSRSWLETFFSQSDSGFEIVEIASAADLLDDGAAYFDYYALTSPTDQLRSSATLLKHLLSDNRTREAALAEGYGSEVIVVVRVLK
jgi:2-polyprenyl-3-methyl-5-hydroxy-6-metoxy-1,4-benzoquinol methylase